MVTYCHPAVVRKPVIQSNISPEDGAVAIRNRLQRRVRSYTTRYDKEGKYSVLRIHLKKSPHVSVLDPGPEDKVISRKNNKKKKISNALVAAADVVKA